jgi:hypothetical protein
MAKDPAFPFYAQDYLVDTLRWSRSMQGLHVSLMAESWANDGLVDENGMPEGLGSTDVQLWLKIKHKWTLTDGRWRNNKIEEVRADRIAFREKQREKGILSGKKRNKKSTEPEPKMNRGSTMVEPIESEDEREGVELKLKGALDEIYLEKQSMNWAHVDFMFEYRSFCEKVRGSPAHYANHDTGGIRLAFQSQLRNAKPIVKKNGTSNNKQQQHSRKLAETVAETYRDVFDGRSNGQSDEASPVNH